MNKLRSVLRDVAGPERVHAADIVFELCENQWLSTLPELKQGEGFERRVRTRERVRASSGVVECRRASPRAWGASAERSRARAFG